MKVQVTSANSPVEYLRSGVAAEGKVHKKPKSEDKDSREINEYLNKLQELVPFTPKNKKLSKLEVISCVIDYIQDLRETLGLPPSPCQNGNDPLDAQFTWCLMDSSNLHDDTQVSSVASSIPATTTTSDFISTSQPQQNRQPLSAIPNPSGSNKDANQNYTTSNSVKVSSSTVSSCVSSTSNSI